MYVARYEEIGIIHSSNILYLKLYGLDESNNLISHIFVPSVSMLSFAQMSSESEKLYMLKFISMYLLKGKSSVSSVDFKKQASLLWQRKNPKPINWEFQSKNILAELDKFGPLGVLVSIKKVKEKNIE
ncbi:hypothetical protein [Xenorhabdus stockiae]|nr:hypothetical protein [Xenorhabdus stockiae]